MELYDIAWEYIGRQKRSQPQTQHGNVDLKTSYWFGNMIVLLTLSPLAYCSGHLCISMGGTATVLHVIFNSNFKSRNNTLKKNLKLMLSK